MTVFARSVPSPVTQSSCITEEMAVDLKDPKAITIEDRNLINFEIRWIAPVSSTFQLLYLDGSILHSLSSDVPTLEIPQMPNYW